MTQLLEKAIEHLRSQPATQQDAIAAIILEELADETRWDESFQRSQDKLKRLAERTRAEIKAGRARDVGIDEL